MPDLTSVVLTVLFCLVFFSISLYITVKHMSWLMHHRILLIGIAIVLGVIVYSIGYLSNDYTDQSWLKSIISGFMAIFSTGRMFVLENDIGEIYGASQSSAYMAFFGTVMIVAMFSVVMVAISFFGYRFISRIKVFFLRIFGRSREIYLFTDLNEDSFSLAKDIRSKQPKSVVLFHVEQTTENENSKKLEGKAAEENFLLLTDSDRVESPVRLLRGFRKNPVHYVICHAQLSENVRITYRIAGDMQNWPTAGNVTLYVFTDYDRFDSAFEQPVFHGINCIPVDRNALASYQLFQRLRLITRASADVSQGQAAGELTVAVAGYSQITPHLYRDIAVQSQFMGLKPRIIAIDGDIADKIAPFLYQNPQFQRCIGLDLIPAVPLSNDFFAFLDDNLPKIDVLICCCEDQKDTVLAAKCIRQRVAAQNLRTHICAAVNAREEAELLFASPILREIEVFGTEDLVHSMDVVINERLDRMAMAVHQYYCQFYGNQTSWGQTSIYERQSSRALALHIPAKLASVGMALTERPGVQQYADLLKNHPDILENLSKGEHRRWNAYLFSQEWSQMPFDDVFQPKDTIRKQHQCLTDWEELAAVS